ncbi:uncharacterized protein LOC113356975 isoform X2 [Papaver somniferum]|uniref:uncharacterized protein LOC113356975 isoform X2 n=1 Tax=Papaver somniferum TaxID=3469 RepID=UPI000E6FB42E|nr:uncharacterized protein LOC113356975 isoform X2 [Papaver somniferum]
MITRPKLAEQLREYQIRSKHDWASVSFFTSTANLNSTSRVDVLISVAWELIILAFLVFSAVSLYFRRLSEYLILVYCHIFPRGTAFITHPHTEKKVMDTELY